MGGCCIPLVPSLSGGGSLHAWPTCRPRYADIYVPVFASFPVCHLGEGLLSRGCLDIPRVGPSLWCPLNFSSDTLGSLTAVHKCRGRHWDRTKREARGDTGSALGRGSSPGSAGFVHVPLPATLAAPPSQRSCRWGRSRWAAPLTWLSKRWTHRCAAAWPGMNDAAKASA